MSAIIITTDEEIIDRDYNAAATDLIASMRIVDNDLSHNEVIARLHDIRVETHAELHMAPLNEHVASYALVDALGQVIVSWHGAINTPCSQCGQSMPAYSYAGYQFQMCQSCAAASPDPVSSTLQSLGITIKD